MDKNPSDILRKYWNFDHFRPLQEDIIRSVLDGKDTLALLPTGGGKSICFQVPALAMEGVCIVVTPLIALMKDQVENLKNRGIPAAAIYHGLSKTELEVVLDNCVYGKKYKFLYLSPERLQTEVLKARLPKMQVCLIAIDEAHCISQWGYDFRPPYLKIAEIRPYFPKVPVLALTATATLRVVEDIQEKLCFSTKNVFRKSFVRTNLAYMVFKEEDKLGRLLRMCNKVQAPGIVYVRNRKRTREIAIFLQHNKISADFYHAGLDQKERDAKQQAWMKEKSKVMVSTNAFGMGIDKPNVRFVAHLDLPESPEAYFQEAGRAGRDEHKSFAVILHNQADLDELKNNHHKAFPEISFIKTVYNSLGNYLQLAVGSGRNVSFPFYVAEFAQNYNFDSAKVYNALKFIEKEGYLLLSDAISTPAKLYIKASKDALYRFQVANLNLDSFIKVILRSYQGLFADFVKINEWDIAKRAGLTVEEAKKKLQYLMQLDLMCYEPAQDQPTITFLENRLSEDHLRISPEVYHRQKEFSRQRMVAMYNYATHSQKCRSQQLIEYFGETTSAPCGVCDVCLFNKSTLKDENFAAMLAITNSVLNSHPVLITDLIEQLCQTYSEQQAILFLKWLTDNEKIIVDKKTQLLSWKNSPKPTNPIS